MISAINQSLMTSQETIGREREREKCDNITNSLLKLVNCSLNVPNLTFGGLFSSHLSFEITYIK